jgi:dTDP-4-amino-4,6-dideoxy-D-galactose acyltransferase
MQALDRKLQTASLLERLDWDSKHFGFPVARIAAAIDDDRLEQALSTARREGVRLVYWSTSADRAAPAAVLSAFNGLLADRKATFARALGSINEETSAERGLHVAAYGAGQASPDLVALAIAAGVHSRFAVDSRIERAKFESLYRVWIERSVRREIAGDVLIAHDGRANQPLAGMITVKVTGDVGNIGLVAVAEAYRGQGVGSRLIEAAHRWMNDRRAAKSTVVTQLANSAACRLYERAGYDIEQVENVYHFWP